MTILAILVVFAYTFSTFYKIFEKKVWTTANQFIQNPSDSELYASNITLQNMINGLDLSFVSK